MTRLKTKYSPEIEAKLRRGKVLSILFIQDRHNPLSLEEEIILFYAFKLKMLDLLPENEVVLFKKGIFDYLKKRSPGLLQNLNQHKELTTEITAELDKHFMNFIKQSKGTETLTAAQNQ